jgi:hypothetical protein
MQEIFRSFFASGENSQVVLQVTGHDDQEQQTKREFLAEWVRAVNGRGGFGAWDSHVSRHPSDIHEILQKRSQYISACSKISPLKSRAFFKP